MNYFLNAGCWESVFAVPGAVVDNYIKLASGSAVKVLLYILKNNGRDVSRSEISSALNISEDDVRDAFNFWEGVNIIKKQDDNQNTKIKNETENIEPVGENENLKLPKIQNSSSAFQITPKEAEQLKQNSREIKALFDMSQQALGNIINHSMIRSLIWQYEYLGLKVDVILMLLSYCASIGKTNIAYIETIAVNWSQNEIDTITKAQDEIQRMKNSNGFYSRMISEFGLKRQPTPNQKKFFDEWNNKGYSVDLISCACERATDSGKALSVNYINGILENWNKKGITTREEAENEIKNFSKTIRYETEQSYDINEFDNFAVTFSKNTKKVE